MAFPFLLRSTSYWDKNQSDVYAGKIVRWKTVETGTISTYGSVEKTTENEINSTINEANHPHVYHAPYQISFDDIDIDTSKQKWVLHGTSDRAPEEEDANDSDPPGYNSTCEVDVIKRGMELPGAEFKDWPDKQQNH